MAAGEVAHWLKALAVLSEVLSSTPDNHIVTHSHVYKWPIVSNLSTYLITRSSIVFSYYMLF